MRVIRTSSAAALMLSAVMAGCEPTGIATESVKLHLTMQLAGGHVVGPTPGRVLVFTDSQPVSRAAASFLRGESCVLSSTPVTVCTFTVPNRATVSLVATEPDPAIIVRFAVQSVRDTVRDGRYVEFTGWSNCEDRTERGLCVVRPSRNITIDANYQLMQQVTVYQVGAARMDYVTIPAALTLKVPPVGYNILDLAGCRRVLARGAPCDSIRLAGDTPYHRFTAFVPRQTIVGMFPVGGAETAFMGWEGDCITEVTYATGVCSLISPRSSGAPVLLTAYYQWWNCPAGPNDRDTGGCQLMEPVPPSPQGLAQRE